MNYPFTRAAFGFFGGHNLNQTDTAHTGLGYIEPVDGRQFAKALKELHHKHDAQIVQAQLNMLSSHDTPRLITIANNDLTSVRLMFLCQMTVAGAPNIYYGDEIALPGARDPDCRRAFPWEDRKRWNTDLLQDVRRFIALRHDCTALRRGDFEIIFSDEQVVVYSRRYQDQYALVAFNVDRQPHSFTLDTAIDRVLENALQPGDVLKPGMTKRLEARSGYVWTTSAG
jgi:neopullulanase